jgi:hypothetical protein
MSNIQETLKDSITGSYEISEQELDLTLGDTVEKETNIVLTLNGAQLIIKKTDSAEDAITTIRNYLSKQLPTGENMSFTPFQRAFFKIEALFDEKDIYAILIFTDKKRASTFEHALYVRWDATDKEWVEADRKLQIWEKIRIKHGRDNIGSIQVVNGSEFLANPRVKYADNMIEIPLNLRDNEKIQNVKVVSEESYRIEIEVQRVAMAYVAKGVRELKISWKRFVFSKQNNAPIRKSEVELEVPQEWYDAFKGELDFEVNPLNTAVHEIIADCEPKYSGDKFFLTHSGQVWVKSQNSWIPVHLDYLKHYLEIEDIKNEVSLYEMIQEMMKPTEDETTV